MVADRVGRVRSPDAPFKSGDNICRVRVSEGWAGRQFGGQFLPRAGQAVRLGFIDGNPERPIIVGRVYNARSDVTKLDFIELRGIGEHVCGAFPELAWNFDNIPAGPGHATNLLLPDLAANRGDGIAEGAVRLGIPGRGSGRERHTGGQVVRPEGDEREQSEQSRGGAHDREV